MARSGSRRCARACGDDGEVLSRATTTSSGAGPTYTRSPNAAGGFAISTIGCCRRASSTTPGTVDTLVQLATAYPYQQSARGLAPAGGRAWPLRWHGATACAIGARTLVLGGAPTTCCSRGGHRCLRGCDSARDVRHHRRCRAFVSSRISRRVHVDGCWHFSTPTERATAASGRGHRREFPPRPHDKAAIARRGVHEAQRADQRDHRAVVGAEREVRESTPAPRALRGSTLQRARSARLAPTPPATTSVARPVASSAASAFADEHVDDRALELARRCPPSSPRAVPPWRRRASGGPA